MQVEIILTSGDQVLQRKFESVALAKHYLSDLVHEYPVQRDDEALRLLSQEYAERIEAMRKEYSDKDLRLHPRTPTDTL
jgi:hypothetical protein